MATFGFLTGADLSAFVGRWVRFSAPEIIGVNSVAGGPVAGLLVRVFDFAGVQWGQVDGGVDERQVVTGGVYAKGDPLTSDSFGRSVLAVGGDSVLALAVEASTGADELRLAFPFSGSAGNGGNSASIPSRRNHSVNGASIEGFDGPFPLLRTNTQVNNVGGFNGGGQGNKAILGHFLDAPLPLGALLSVSMDYEFVTPETPVPLNNPYFNVVVEFDPVNFPKVYSILSFGDLGLLNVGTNTIIGPNRRRTTWAPGANFIQVVNDKGAGPPSPPPPIPTAGPATIPVAEGPPQPVTWVAHDYSIASLLLAYPNARIVNADSGDGGLPKNTITAGLLILLGDSNAVKQESVRILAWELNGASI